MESKAILCDGGDGAKSDIRVVYADDFEQLERDFPKPGIAWFALCKDGSIYFAQRKDETDEGEWVDNPF